MNRTFDFKIGDRVRLNNNPDHEDDGDFMRHFRRRRVMGTVKRITPNKDPKWVLVGIRWDEPHPDLHNLRGGCDPHHGWNVWAHGLEPILPTGFTVKAQKFTDYDAAVAHATKLAKQLNEPVAVEPTYA